MEKNIDPFNYPFPKKQETMYLSTISTFSMIKPRMTSNLPIPSTHKIPPFRKKIFKEPNLKVLYLLSRQLHHFLYLPMWNPNQITIRKLIRFQTPSIEMISMEQGLKKINLQLKE